MKRLLIADDHPLLLAGLKMLFNGSDYRVVSAVRDGEAVMAAIRSSKPDMLILDLNMPGRSAKDLLLNLRLQGNAIPVVLLTAHISNRDLIEILDLGVEGIVMKDGAEDLLIRCLDHISEGRRWIDRKLLDRAVALSEAEGRLPGNGSLTDREQEIARMAIGGMRNADIAGQLGLAEGTVKAHLFKVYEKLGVARRADLVFAMTFGKAFTSTDASLRP